MDQRIRLMSQPSCIGYYYCLNHDRLSWIYVKIKLREIGLIKISPGFYKQQNRNDNHNRGNKNNKITCFEFPF